MIYLLDGSNILGQFGGDRTSSEAKRKLVRAVASYARKSKAKVICVFDGAMEEQFGTRLGAVTVRFSAPRSADDILVEESQGVRNEPVRVVTSDTGLAGRVRRRGVEVIASAAFARFLESEQESPAAIDEDWARYFSDPKNRNV